MTKAMELQPSKTSDAHLRMLEELCEVDGRLGGGVSSIAGTTEEAFAHSATRALPVPTCKSACCENAVSEPPGRAPGCSSRCFPARARGRRTRARTCLRERRSSSTSCTPRSRPGGGGLGSHCSAGGPWSRGRALQLHVLSSVSGPCDSDLLIAFCVSDQRCSTLLGALGLPRSRSPCAPFQSVFGLRPVCRAAPPLPSTVSPSIPRARGVSARFPSAAPSAS